MIDPPEKLGKALDELVLNYKRLGITHAVLGVMAALAYWARPGTFTPHRPFARGPDIEPIVLTSIAWAPHLIGYLFARWSLVASGSKAVILYILLSTIVTAISVGIYLNFMSTTRMEDPVLVSVFATIAFCFLSICISAIVRAQRSNK